MRETEGGFAHYDGSDDPAYMFVADVLSIEHTYYNDIAELHKTDVGKEIKRYAEKFEKWPDGIPARIQYGYIELEYFFREFDALWPEDYESLVDSVELYERELDTVATVLTVMEDIRQERGCS